MRSSDNTNRDLWHRDFCPWMRYRKLKIAIYYIVELMFVSMNFFVQYLSLRHGNLIAVARDTGVPLVILSLFLAVSILTNVALIWHIFALPKHIGYRGVVNVSQASLLGVCNLVIQLSRTKKASWTHSDYIFAWWLMSGLSLALCLGFLIIFVILLIRIRLGKDLSSWIPKQP